MLYGRESPEDYEPVGEHDFDHYEDWDTIPPPLPKDPSRLTWRQCLEIGEAKLKAEAQAKLDQEAAEEARWQAIVDRPQPLRPRELEIDWGGRKWLPPPRNVPKHLERYWDIPLYQRIAQYGKLNEQGCWLWQQLDGEGYGVISYRGKKQYVTRASYETFVAIISPGNVIKHTCGVRNCANPEHLHETKPDAPPGRKTVATHCHRGHAFDAANTGWQRRPYGVSRYCKTCRTQGLAKTQPRTKPIKSNKVLRLAKELFVTASTPFLYKHAQRAEKALAELKAIALATYRPDPIAAAWQQSRSTQATGDILWAFRYAGTITSDDRWEGQCVAHGAYGVDDKRRNCDACVEKAKEKMPVVTWAMLDEAIGMRRAEMEALVERLDREDERVRLGTETEDQKQERLKREMFQRKLDYYDLVGGQRIEENMRKYRKEQGLTPTPRGYYKQQKLQEQLKTDLFTLTFCN